MKAAWTFYQRHQTTRGVPRQMSAQDSACSHFTGKIKSNTEIWSSFCTVHIVLLFFFSFFFFCLPFVVNKVVYILDCTSIQAMLMCQRRQLRWSGHIYLNGGLSTSKAYALWWIDSRLSFSWGSTKALQRSDKENFGSLLTRRRHLGNGCTWPQFELLSLQ